MAAITPSAEVAATARLAGLLYLVIILCGLGAELAIRGPLITPGDFAATEAAIAAEPARFRLGILADLVMALCDAGVAVLLYRLLKPVSPGLALAATAFRLVQTAVIAANLLLLQFALILLEGPADVPPGLPAALVELHGVGYDVGLAFFGVCSLLTGALVWRSALISPVFGAGLAAAGLVYLTGSLLRILSPEAHAAFAPAYAVPILAETAFCLRLLFQRPAR